MLDQQQKRPASIWGHLASFCIDSGSFCYVLHQLGAILLRSASILCRFKCRPQRSGIKLMQNAAKRKPMVVDRSFFTKWFWVNLLIF